MARTKAIAGGGAWMVALALQVIPQTWPALLSPHPWAVGAFMLIGALMFGYATVDQEPIGASSNSVGGDNSGDQIIAKDSVVHKGDIHEHHHYPSPLVEFPLPPTPNLVISGPELCFLRFNYLYWQREDKGMLGAICWIHNKPAPKGGGQTGVASEVSVGLTLRASGRTIAVVSHACLLEHRENAIDLDNNERHAVLIATLRGPVMTVYDNHTDVDRQIWLRSKPLPKSPVVRNQSVTVGSMVEVDVIATSGGETLVEHTFKFVKNADNSLTIV